MRRNLLGIGVIMISLASATSSPKADDWQDLYNVRLKPWNTVRHSLGRSFAFIAGTNGNGSRCFWKYGNAATAEAYAISAAATCSKQYTNCQLFGASDVTKYKVRGLSRWASEISTNGGLSVAVARQRQQQREQQTASEDDDPNLDPLIGAFVGGAAAIMNNRQPRQRVPVYRSAPVYSAPVQRGSGGGGGNRCPGATIAVDENCRPLH
jgi:hypothetical protein